jgi:acyl-CoA reductase-like NAD-dependent aldehyde dehydrogenase
VKASACNNSLPPINPAIGLQVLNPATGKVVATLPKMKADETLTAIAAAHAVFPQWSNTTAKERGAILRK